MLILVVGMLVFILVFVIGCGGNSTNKTPEPYFPVQKEFQTIYMQSLLTGGKLAIDNAGYLRAGATKGVLIIWPYGYSLKIEGKNTWIINDKGQAVAKVGDAVELGGGFVDASVVEVIIGYALPMDAAGPYWVAAPLKSNQ